MPICPSLCEKPQKKRLTPLNEAIRSAQRSGTRATRATAPHPGTRKGMPDELKEQVPIIKDVLRAMNIHIFELEGYEADDILGTIASLNEKNTKEDIFTYILTGDRDSYQLISDKTSIIFPSSKMGKTDYTVYTPQLLKEEKNIEPYQVVDIKSLMGDSSDNIPGVKGIGEKTAYSLIEKYTTLDNIYANIDNLDASAKIIEKLKNDEKMARLSYTLATINKEVPIDLQYDEVRVKEVNKDELYPLFKRLAFNKFIAKYDFDKVKEDVKENSINSSDINISKDNILILDKKNIKNYEQELKDVLNGDKVSYILNINYSNQAFSSILNINDKSFISLYSKQTEKCYIILLDSWNVEVNEDKEYLEYIFKLFANSECEKLGYNIKQDIRFIFTNVCDKINKFSYDLLLGCYLLDSTRNFKFEGILEELFGVILIFGSNSKEPVQLSLFETEEKDNINLDENMSTEIALATKGIYLSKEIIDERLKKDNMYSLMYDIEIPLSETLASMETTGMYVDKKKLEEFGKEISIRINELETQIYDLAGEEFNINSPQQLGTILFDKLKLPGNIWYIGTINNDDSTFMVTDKVYDRAMPIDINTKVDPFECREQEALNLNSTYLESLFQDAIEKHPVSKPNLELVNEIDDYVIKHFRISFGNRIMKQLNTFVAVYVGCGGNEIDGIDYFIAKKILRKFDQLSVSFIRDEIDPFISFLNKRVGKGVMKECIFYLETLKKSI